MKYHASDPENRYIANTRPFGGTTTFTVKVATKNSFHRYNGTGASNGFTIDGEQAPFLTFTPGRVYKFDQADSSNSGHPLVFYEEAEELGIVLKAVDDEKLLTETYKIASIIAKKPSNTLRYTKRLELWYRSFGFEWDLSKKYMIYRPDVEPLKMVG